MSGKLCSLDHVFDGQGPVILGPAAKMTVDEMLSVITDRCSTANPEIKSLKLGCEVLVRAPHLPVEDRVLVVVRTTVLRTDPKYFCSPASPLRWRGVCGFYSEDAFSKIIGRPIRLADVLLAIQYTGGPLHAVDETGLLLEMSPDGFKKIPSKGHGHVMWDLRTDELREQNQEMIECIYRILAT